MQSMIKRNYLQRRKNDILATLGYLIVTLALFYLDFKYWTMIPSFFFLAFTADLIRGKKFHKIIIDWLDNNPNSQIFIYSSKKQYLNTIENEILPILNDKVFVAKNDNAKITGDLSRTIYYELHQIMTIKDLPLIISFHGNEYNKTSLKKYLDSYKNKDITQTELLTVIREKMHRA